MSIYKEVGDKLAQCSVFAENVVYTEDIYKPQDYMEMLKKLKEGGFARSRLYQQILRHLEFLKCVYDNFEPIDEETKKCICEFLCNQ